jgi:hypothetical protein
MARRLRRLDLPRGHHENQFAELDAHNSETASPSSTVAVKLTVCNRLQTGYAVRSIFYR